MDYIFLFTRILCLNRSNGLKSLVLLLCFVLTKTVAVKQSDEFLNIFKKTSPFEEFKSHEVVFLRVFNGEEEINATWSSLTGGHLREITVKFTAFRLNFVLKLEQNILLFGSNYVEKRFPSSGGEDEGFHRNHTPTNCYYNGHVVGQKAESTVALSTCNGVRGYILTGKDGYHIEPEQSTLNSKHFVFRDSDYVGRNLSCGEECTLYEGFILYVNLTSGKPESASHDNEASFKWKAPSSHSFKKLKRSLQWPYDANDKTMVVELYIANDRSQFIERGQNVEDVLRRTKDIVNIVSSLYRPLNMYVVLVGVEVWQDEDKIEIFDNADKTMNSFLDYRRHHISPYHRNDNAQLITGRTLGDGVVGKAPIMTICTWQYSGGVNLDHSQLVGPVATTVAHEMGHNFGLTHDTEICGCPDDRCIMAPSSGGQKNPTKWSECSKQQFKDAFHQGMDYCLHNLPDQLYGSEAECGNGFTEAGEECDCGLPQDCTNPCCNATTCRLVPNATCSVGSCCDQTTCQPKPAATVCRPVKGECDLGEYCDGTSELCPSDASKHDGYECSNRGLKSYCYNGLCNTHDSQCRLLWGETGRSSHRLCFEQFNTLGTANGHCGFNWVDGKTFKKCDSRDVLCGMMHCQHRSEKLMFWKEALAYTLPESYVNINQTRLDCKSAILDVGLNMPDPGMVPDGAKCGDQKMCMKQQCRDISPLQLGKTCGNCHDHGVCNSLNQCHCDIGYAPLFCDHSGNGGSLHSGPVQIQRANVGLIVGLCVFFLLVLPLIMLLSYCGYQYRKQIKRFWMTQQGDRYRSVYRASPQQANDRQMNQIVRQPSGVSAPRIVNGTTPLPPIPVTTAVSRSPNHYHDTPKRVKGGENRGSRPNVPSNMAPSKVYQNGGLHSAVHENGEADSRLRTGQPAMDEKLVPTRAALAPPAAVKQPNGAGVPVHGCDQNWSRKAPKRPPLPQNGQMVSSIDDPLSDAAAKSGFSSGLHVFNGDFLPHSSGKVYLHQNGSVASATNPPNNQNIFPSAHRAHNTESHGNPRIPQAKIFHQVDVDTQKPIKTRRSNGAKPSVKPATQQPTMGPSSFIAQESCGSSQQPSNPQGFGQRQEVDCDAVRGNSKPTLPPKPPPAPATRSHPKSRTNRFGVSESQC